MIWSWIYRNMSIHRFWISRCTWEILNIWVRINGIFNDNKHTMFYIRWETPSQKPRAWKLRNWNDCDTCTDVNLRAPHCLVARTPLLSCEDRPFTFILHRLNRAEITGICHGRGHILNYVMARRGVLTNQKPPLI